MTGPHTTTAPPASSPAAAFTSPGFPVTGRLGRHAAVCAYRFSGGTTRTGRVE
jgi:hypothetical protein